MRSKVGTWGIIGALAVSAMLLASVAARADTWSIDPAHTSVGFSVRHMMISNVKGTFQKLGGSVSANGRDPGSVQVTATIDSASIDTRIDKRDAHLKSPDFLDVAKFPTITFKSTKIETDGDGKWKMTGDLTLHGVTKPVTLEVSGPTAPIKDPFGKTRAGASATTTINRKDFGLTWNKAMEAGGVLVGDEVSISIDVEATKE